MPRLRVIERNRCNGWKLTAVATHFVNGQLVPIKSQENDELSTSADVMQGDASAIVSVASSESAFAHEPVANTAADPISGPVAGRVSSLAHEPVSVPTRGLFSGPTYGIVDSPPDGFAAGPAHDLVYNPADSLTDSPVDATISAPVTSVAPAHTPLVHPADPGVGVSAPPALIGPGGPMTRTQM